MEDQYSVANDDNKSLKSRRKNGPYRGSLGKVVGQCDSDDKYCHNYLDCEKCEVDKTNQCDIQLCPCNSLGFLFKVSGKEGCYSHQIPGHLTSTRIYKSRTKRAFASINKTIEKNKSIVLSRYSRSREVKKRRNEELGCKRFKNVRVIKILASRMKSFLGDECVMKQPPPKRSRISNDESQMVTDNSAQSMMISISSTNTPCQYEFPTIDVIMDQSGFDGNNLDDLSAIGLDVNSDDQMILGSPR